jgi:aldose 1-epimerase
MEVTNYGATLVSVTVPDKNGSFADVILGYEDVSDYISHRGCLGATIGRNGNRIGGATVTISGKEYPLDDNENGNNLHSGFVGYNKMVWNMEVQKDRLAVKFSRRSPDGEQGFPGNFDVSVTYTLTEENEVQIHYEGVSDKDTIANMTNHSYFNLAGHGSGTVLEQTMWIDSDAITENNQASIPTGVIRDIRGTAMDFNEPKKIGRDIEEDYDQLQFANGYDHNYVLKDQGTGVRKVAEAVDEESGRVLEVFTDCVGVQFYTGNFIEAGSLGKAGALYGPRHGFCLETQFYPDANHHENFPSSIIKAGEKYDSTTIYKFSVRA